MACAGLAVWTRSFPTSVTSWLVDPADPAVLAMDLAARRTRIVHSLRAMVLRGARLRPLILVFEDMHWADSSTKEYLDFFMDSVTGARLMLILPATVITRLLLLLGATRRWLVAISAWRPLVAASHGRRATPPVFVRSLRNSSSWEFDARWYALYTELRFWLSNVDRGSRFYGSAQFGNRNRG
jgi:hypothetical protein